MPNCLYCKKVFMNRQVLGNHIKKHLDDSNEDLPLPNQTNRINLVEITTRILNNQNKLERQNLSKTDTNYKQICFERNLDNSLRDINSNVYGSIEQQNPSTSSFNCISDIQNFESIEEQDVEFFDYSDLQSNISDKSIEKQDVGFFDHSDHSDSQSNTSDEQSDLSDITNVDINEYAEYDDLHSEKPKEPEDIYQEFSSEEYAEFMHIITWFHIQDPLANSFICFFNKYSNRNNHLLPSTSQSGQAFIEDLNLPFFC
ncbi:4298_t:CDS:1 [Cetraspora pellucida]|uniref:4298_t:CDS:1 n=1 Tax=Cetraspora pellucida TaxID=1433469 RepID=A0ACA9PGY4_9GLOM|nr:4298_t:CDS:1 [Cetraspora pellucida]